MTLMRALKPHIDARRFPVVRLVENIHFAVAIEIGDPSLMETDAGGEHSCSEVALAIAKENPGRRVGIVRVFSVFGPLSHLGGKNVQVTITIDIGYLQAMSVNQVTLN